MNEERADWALVAADAFGLEVFHGRTFSSMADGVEPGGDFGDGPDLIADLICDLLHLADRHGLGARDLLNQGLRAYEHESAPDYQGD
jgi:hypothetical protein